jgi:hypothetical protein
MLVPVPVPLPVSRPPSPVPRPPSPVRVLVSVRVRVLVIVLMPMIVIVPMPVMRMPLPHHAFSSTITSCPSIRCTAIAAPNPLSMFTTTIPEAQLDSIANSAVNPPSAVP